MVAIKEHEPVNWLCPSPLWENLNGSNLNGHPEHLMRPSILRFSSDAFMDEINAILAYHPASLAGWQAQYETWEQPMATPAIPDTVPDLSERVSMRSRRLTRSGIQIQNELQDRAAATTTGQQENAPEQNQRKLKLYQPIQQRHYLISASLVCRRFGFPDRTVDAGKQERVSYVLRRIFLVDDQTEPDDNPANWQECAYLRGANGSHWQPIDLEQETQLFPGEERLGMFPQAFNEMDNHPRKLFCGVIPVGRREEYLAAPRHSSETEGDPQSATQQASDARVFLLQMQVTGPWSDLVSQARRQKLSLASATQGSLTQVLQDVFGSPPSGANPGLLRNGRNQAQTISWYLLLDLERFLHRYLRSLWNYIQENVEAEPLSDEDTAVYNWLTSVTLDDTLRTGLESSLSGSGYTVLSNLIQALQAISDNDIRDNLERVDTQFNIEEPAGSNENALWPTFLFPLADCGERGPIPLQIGADDFAGLPSETEQLQDPDPNFSLELENLVTLVGEALAQREISVQPEAFIANPDTIDGRSAWFTIRCVYERPNCGSRAPTIVGEPSEPFEMASFFDPDAPVRQALIAMPFDISPAGLRKYKKGTTIAISDMLCGQIKRIRKLTFGDLVLSVLPWPFHKDLPDVGGSGPCGQSPNNTFGMFCSLSIPIVTLCALILLIIMVTLFDIFFRWIPFLFLCLPIPGLKGKKS